MSDLKRSLREWTESAAEPVTASEAIQRAAEREAARDKTRRNWVAALGAAALVLLAIGLPFWLRDPQPDPEPGPPSDPTAVVATVPDWEGRRIEDARAEADRLGIDLHEEPTVADDASPGSVVRQDPAPGEPVPEDRTVTVGVVRQPYAQVPTTSTVVTTTCHLPEYRPRAGERYITVFYGCEVAPDHQVQPVLRAIPSGEEDLMQTAVRSLLAGPTPDERAAGIVSELVGTEGALNSVTFDSGSVTVDLASEITSISLPDRDIVSLFATVFQFETTQNVEITIDGSCDEFADWSGRECQMDAADWWHEDQAREMIAGWPRVAAWPASVTGPCDMSEPEPKAGEMLVEVFFSCPSADDTLLELTGFSRIVPAGSSPIRATLSEAVKGPSGAERSMGAPGSFLSERTYLMVRDVATDGSRLMVDFHPFVRSPEISNIGTSTGGLIFNTVLNANLFQFPDVEEIEYRVDGSCDAYWAIFEADCSIQTRQAHQDALDNLSN